MSYTYEYPHFAVTVDNVIFNLKDPNDPKVLLINRKNEPFKGKLALPGGFLDPEDRSAMAGAIRELKEETNLYFNQLIQTCALTREGRDPRERCISIVYANTLHDDYEDIIKAQDDALKVQWVSLLELKKNDLAFDHATAIWKSIQELFDEESKCISEFCIDRDRNQYQHTKRILDTIKLNLGKSPFPIF